MNEIGITNSYKRPSDVKLNVRRPLVTFFGQLVIFFARLVIMFRIKFMIV